MMCFDFDNKCGTDNNDKLHTAICTLNRYDKRQKKRLSEREILISDENELRTCINRFGARLCGNLLPLPASKSLEIRQYSCGFFSCHRQNLAANPHTAPIDTGS